MDAETFQVVELSSRLEIAAFAFLVYDYLLAISDEFPRLWQRPLSRSSLFFFAIRYLPLLSSLLIVLLGYAPALALSCDAYLWCSKVKILVTQFCVCFIMGMRVMAMYYNDRRVVILVAGVAVILLGISILFIVHDESTTVYRFVKVGVHLCHVASYETRDAYAWITQAVFDGFVLVLTVVRALVSWRNENGLHGLTSTHRSLADLMFHDGILYYVVITLATVANILTYFIGSPAARGYLSAGASAISTTMLARLTLHLHAAVEYTARTSRSVDLEMHDVGAESTLRYGDPDAEGVED
ncbi:hypothetical protein PENSPDRAFT_455985 [Peniophora sp. CONT]|nr:hypothetical protein PENSPDRAFT_455985 [Peniophora sp. CONT]